MNQQGCSGCSTTAGSGACPVHGGGKPGEIQSPLPGVLSGLETIEKLRRELRLARAAMVEVDELRRQVKELVGFLRARRAMEPQHSREDHECGECGFLAQFREPLGGRQEGGER